MNGSEIVAAYQRAKAKSAAGEFNFLLLRELIAEIEREEFGNQAGYLCNFKPWHEMKDILGLISEKAD